MGWVGCEHGREEGDGVCTRVCVHIGTSLPTSAMGPASSAQITERKRKEKKQNQRRNLGTSPYFFPAHPKGSNKNGRLILRLPPRPQSSVCFRRYAKFLYII